MTSDKKALKTGGYERMKTGRKVEKSLSTSTEEAENRFAARMQHCADLVGNVTALAKKAGIPQSTIRPYFHGGEPRRPHLVAIAEAAGVRIEWLATGNGPKYAAEQGVSEPSAAYASAGASRHEPGRTAAPNTPQKSAVEVDKIEEIVTKTKRKFEELGVDLTPEAEGRVIRLICELYIRQGENFDDASLDNVIELAAFR